MIRNAFWFATGVASTFATCLAVAKHIKKTDPKRHEQMFADAKNF